MGGALKKKVKSLQETMIPHENQTSRPTEDQAFVYQSYGCRLCTKSFKKLKYWLSSEDFLFVCLFVFCLSHHLKMLEHINKTAAQKHASKTFLTKINTSIGKAITE